MADVLKGNFTPRSGVQVDTGDVQSLEDQFEREALKRLGGSIAFVSKKRVLWPEEPDSGTADSDGKAE